MAIEVDNQEFIIATYFKSRTESGFAFNRVLQLLPTPDVDLSAYHFTLSGRWHVAVVSAQMPVKKTQEAVLEVLLGNGKLTQLSDKAHRVLLGRHHEAMAGSLKMVVHAYPELLKFRV